MKQASLWEPLEDKKVYCFLCGHRCKIPEGSKGVCQVRENRDGILYTLVYDKVIARHIDPIEKKPLFHFYPGSRSYSIATPGCNFKCLFCQNADIAQMPRDIKAIIGEAVSPQSIVDEALKSGCKSIAYTYTEPTVFFELAFDTAKLAVDAGIKNVFVTNGYITPEALKTIKPYLDAANIDLKGFTEEFYRKVCGAKLELVLESIKNYYDSGIWIELTTLVIPGHNDSEEELRSIARFIVSINPEIPWHVSRFYPTYKLTDQPPTPLSTLSMARRIGIEEGLKYVYEGNAPGQGGEDTPCPACGKILITRYGNIMTGNYTKNGACGCGAKIAGAGL
ncbi:MAG: AmmeMemoRadiSam system radical SAM enzyme [Nitrospirota bacterium]